MASGKINYNASISAATNTQVCPANASRTSFFFKNVSGDDAVLNFGANATAANVLKIADGESIYITKGDPYQVEAQINVFITAGGAIEAQAEEMSLT